MATIDYFLVSASGDVHRLDPEQTYVFGRDPGVDILVADAMASRRHAELIWTEHRGGGWAAVDLASRNGVMVEGQRIAAPTLLADGATLQIGGQVFRLHMLPPGSDPASVGKQAPEISIQETMGAGVAFTDLATQGATFTGEVTGGVPELLQFFMATAKTGRLDLLGGSAGRLPASVWIAQGTPVHADFKGVAGMDALLRLATDPPKRFAFHADVAAPGTRTLQGNATAILMDLARRLDEAVR